ncbi:MAG: tRNA (adenosine(37)-N6)-dimethylallyltransferase MiaA [Patescibacteria group bacterium]|nr:tRNA (adenosine(37)-N6)-dimethylallyltransferase MiaA [Patescibacteria group bacterium]MDE1988097.1 tRNA (adenosine(37)-N6)-dimethylallyltransferase MiaA [Patescibacteria group bacterium]MDE2218202.1 tRNA (adenosine(37)-N6)-dimethylallyltransferase MiaA [Patescibacteria group bacterium]
MSRKIIVILGPTASGKSALAVRVAKKFNGEIISADSRQVYKGLNIGTGKITKKDMGGIPHHCLDIVSPKKIFTVAEFKKCAEEAAEKIFAKNKTPIIVGGTGLYIQAVVDNVVLPEVKPNWKLRKELEKKTTEEIFAILKKLDPDRAKNIDAKNPRRLIRAIEIAKALGKVPNLGAQLPSWEAIRIGIRLSDRKLKKNINKRLVYRLRKGMIAEAKKLHGQGLSWKRMNELCLEYRYLTKFLRGEISKIEMIEKLKGEIWHYAKRQMTWFKKDKRIKWVDNYKQAEKFMKEFLK